MEQCSPEVAEILDATALLLEQDMVGTPNNYMIGIAVVFIDHDCTFVSCSHCNKFILVSHQGVLAIWFLQETSTPMIVQ